MRADSKSSSFEVTFLSREDFDFLAAEISFNGQRLCQVMRSNDDCVEIEFLEERFELKRPVTLRFPLDEFLLTISQAKIELMLLQKDDS